LLSESDDRSLLGANGVINGGFDVPNYTPGSLNLVTTRRLRSHTSTPLFSVRMRSDKSGMPTGGSSTGPGFSTSIQPWSKTPPSLRGSRLSFAQSSSTYSTILSSKIRAATLAAPRRLA
jgi:hypothetical protein